MKMNPVVHFEMPAEDTARMTDFYAKTFGWVGKNMGPDLGNYVVVQTTETDEDGMIKNPGAINGGIYPKTKPEQGIHVVISVDDIHEHMKKIEEAGGKMLGGDSGQEFDDIPGVGKYATFVDTEGNHVGILQPVAGM
jgi:predicted enzyme related to lactoylglutathione lyase